MAYGTGLTIRSAVLLTPLVVAVMVVDAASKMDLVVTANVTVVAPAGTVTVAGTVAAVVLELESVTTSPRVGAALPRVIVPVTTVPEMALDDESVRLLSGGAARVISAVLVTAPATALIVTGVATATGWVVIANVAVVAPARTVTVAGTATAIVLELESVTTSPPVGAAPVKVIVPVDGDPPVREAGARARLPRDGATRVSVAVFVRPPTTALIVTEVVLATGWVATVNVAVVAPAGTVTLEGKVADAVFELESVTVRPPVGAGPVRVIVPVDRAPPVRAAGLSDRADRDAGLTVMAAVWLRPLAVAVIVTSAAAKTGFDVAVKVAEVAPAGTVTVAGTVAAAVFELLSEATNPLVGAAPVRVIVPVDGEPPVAAVGLIDRDDRVAGLTMMGAVLLTPPEVAVMVTVAAAATAPV